MMRRNRKRNRLVDKVIYYKPFKDDEGRYLPYCDFGYHQGLLRDPKICETRYCKHYHKLYIQNGKTK